MKLLTLNFLTCAIKTCKPLPSAFPLHIRDAEMESIELDFNPLFLRNVMSRIEWKAMQTVLAEVGLKLPPSVLSSYALGDAPLKDEMEASTDETQVAVGEQPAQARLGEDGGMDVDVPISSESRPEGQDKEEEDRREDEEEEEVSEETLRKLHELLMETNIVSGKLVCGNCGYAYAVKEGIPNFLLPAHLV